MAPPMSDTKREREIGTTLFDHELDLVRQGAKATKKKLATYVRDVVLDAARRDASVSEPAVPAPAIDIEAITDQVATKILARLGLSAEKKGSAEESA